MAKNPSDPRERKNKATVGRKKKPHAKVPKNECIVASASDLEKLDLTEKLRITLDFTYDWEYWIAPDGKIVYMSPSCERISGYRREEFIKNPKLMNDIVHPDDQHIISKHLEASDQGTLFTARFRIINRNGETCWIEHVCQAVFGTDGKWLGRRASNRNITAQKQADEEILRINRELRAISDCNQIMVRADNEEELCWEVCRIMCEVAGYRMAWVGMKQYDKARTVQPCSWGGYEEGYLTASKFSWADNDYGKGPTGLAIHTGTTHFMQDFDSVPSGAPWRKAALARGYRSSIALPLKNIAGETIGAFMLYADKPNAFGASHHQGFQHLGTGGIGDGDGAFAGFFGEAGNGGEILDHGGCLLGGAGDGKFSMDGEDGARLFVIARIGTVTRKIIDITKRRFQPDDAEFLGINVTV